MSEIRTTKIDGQEFVQLKDYQKLLEKNRNLKLDLEKFSEAYRRYRDYEKEELAESCYDLERENKKLRETITDLSKSNYKSVNQRNDLERENQKLKERVAELERCNSNLQEYIDKQNKDYEPQFEHWFPKYKF